MTVLIDVDSSASPERVWELYAQPERWKEWAPHIRYPHGLGAPEVEPGASGRIHLAGLAPVWAEVTSKRPGQSWTWRVGLVELTHT
ncbi:MAG: SRPBCC family protein, partial [Actinomycetota bacterium]|nr:SRPBCC family protein [Actinomycetota bacterium]